ncbi:MAG: hypothetical protein KJ804_17960 [Proteobacteria bacterium]|nr:hypothetical protein [Pseudomonadota bacterium]MBU1060194.1 hypothetical protein [Pseudomonadota bacterium]
MSPAPWIFSIALHRENQSAFSVWHHAGVTDHYRQCQADIVAGLFVNNCDIVVFTPRQSPGVIEDDSSNAISGTTGCCQCIREFRNGGINCILCLRLPVFSPIGAVVVGT